MQKPAGGRLDRRLAAIIPDSVFRSCLYVRQRLFGVSDENMRVSHFAVVNCFLRMADRFPQVILRQRAARAISAATFKPRPKKMSAVRFDPSPWRFASFRGMVSG